MKVGARTTGHAKTLVVILAAQDSTVNLRYVSRQPVKGPSLWKPEYADTLDNTRSTAYPKRMCLGDKNNEHER
ncbi:hypothetical protein HZ326_5230 [Fusarium oxysporum f. sp. albedinis]|nr:hypothetical protein HZ326_5230 [Fusarium oxysporum f. sp. albedinis]